MMNALGMTAHNALAWCGRHNTQILTVAGIGCSVGAIAMTARATLKTVDICKEHKDQMELVRESLKEVEDEREKASDISKQYVKTACKVAAQWAPVILLEGASIACTVKCNQEWSKKYNAVSGALMATEAVLGRLERNIKDKYGVDELRELKYGIKKQEVDVIKEDADGNVTVEKEEVETVSKDAQGSIEGYSEYARFFDESCYEWDKNAEYNMTFLRIAQADMNNQLQIRGHLYLNEVYDKLGIPRTDAGQDVGWIFDPNDPTLQNYVDFGILNLHKEANRRFVNGYEPVILLDFNVDGNIRKMLYSGE